MCTLVVLRRPDHPWPLLLAANRDEMRDRPWSPPARHWPDRPHVLAGRDDLAGGSWLSLGDQGLIAAVLNRRGALGPQAGHHSRGRLALEALDHPDAAAAAGALAGLDARAFRPFNLVVADPSHAFWLRCDGLRVSVHALPDGLSMLTAGELDDPSSARIATFRPRFAAAPPPDPDRNEWTAWERLLADGASATADPRDAMTIRTNGAYGTVSSALIALTTDGRRFRFAAGPPDRTSFEPVEG